MPKADTYERVRWRVLLPVSHWASFTYQALGMGWFQSFCAAADAGASRAVKSVNAIINFVNLQNLCLAIPKSTDHVGWPCGLNYQIWVSFSITDLCG